ncbi:uncharacterized protein LOC110835033 isoform X5 [Zootermopsis nevadensis]|uniref:uncharacterized protein LOC110835033 isoform X5 n=1 Tax=Zootermopsis nevadensis TaxID=136037 RepID=UPI000B8EB266|nr:uncharacterized protein LOC110835033 isoform X5 [Zootermopsis nevadensis]
MNRSKLRNHHATSLTILKDTKRRKQNGLNPAQRYFPESRPIGIQCDLGSIHILNILFVENTVIGKFILFHVITSHIALPFPKTDTKKTCQNGDMLWKKCYCQMLKTGVRSRLVSPD